jgi:hypothetical protein
VRELVGRRVLSFFDFHDATSKRKTQLLNSTFFCFDRDGYETSRDSRTGDILAELLLQTPAGTPMAALVSYSSPWPLGEFGKQV